MTMKGRRQEGGIEATGCAKAGGILKNRAGRGSKQDKGKRMEEKPQGPETKWGPMRAAQSLANRKKGGTI